MLLTVRGLAAGALLALGLIVAAATPVAADEAEWRDIAVETRPVPWNADDPEEVTAGPLAWNGGLELVSDDNEFGGWSGLHLARAADGAVALLAVSDAGQWLAARLRHDEEGRLVGLDTARMAPLADPQVAPDAEKWEVDAEALTVDEAAGEVYVAFEHNHRINRYRLVTDAPPVFDARVEGPFAELEMNKGLEALALIDTPNGPGLFAVTERSLKGGDHRAFLFDGADWTERRVRRTRPWDVTDIARLPSGDFILLERRFSLLGGVGMRMRRITRDEVIAGGTIEGTEMLTAAPPYAIDNMEGIAVLDAPPRLRHSDVVETSNGHESDMVLYVVSDDNFNPLQRTLLVSFRMGG